MKTIYKNLQHVMRRIWDMTKCKSMKAITNNLILIKYANGLKCDY